MTPAIPMGQRAAALQEEHALLTAKLAGLFQVLPGSLISACVLAVLTCTVLWRFTLQPEVWSWGAVLLSVNCGRALLLYRYRARPRTKETLEQLLRWRQLFLAGCVSAGIGWGLLPVLVFPEQANLRMLIAFVLAGSAAGAVTSLSAERWAAFAFVVPSVLPLAIRLMMLGDGASIAMSIMVVLFLAMISGSVHRMSTQLRDLVVARQRADRHAQELEEAQARVNVLNDRLTMATRAGKVGVWEWDIATNELFWDDALYEMYHIDRDVGPMNYEAWRQRIHPQDIARPEALLTEALQGKDVTTEFRVIWPDGTERHIKSSCIVKRGADGAPLRMIGMNSDITELKQVGRMKNEFVSIVSHELRTPLTSLRGAMGLVASGVVSADPAKLSRLVDLANRNAERLAVLIDDILDMDKIECGKMRLDLRPHPLLPLLEQAIASSSSYASLHGVTLALMPSAVTVDVEVDTNRFLQVLANLLSNAAKFSPAGSRVTVSARSVALDRVRVLVVDQGPGISPEFQKKLFGKFCQGDSNDNRVKSGSGLGLAISKAIVEQMNGSIGFETSSAGTTFFVDLPIHECHEGAAHAEDPTRTTLVRVNISA